MNKQEIVEKLKDIGIDTDNCYPKTSFMKGGIAYVGLYLREMDEDFYFHNKYDKKIYKFPKTEDFESYDVEKFLNGFKYQIPTSQCQVVWEDKPFEEKPDKAYKEMTLREYACIQMGIPNSGTPWLDTLIKEKNNNNNDKT